MAKCVLAMYDIRGKQEFIFRTNKIKEIVGGSCLIRDCFKDYLYPAAIRYANENSGKIAATVKERAASGKNVIFNYLDVENVAQEKIDGSADSSGNQMEELDAQIKELERVVKKEKDKEKKKELDKLKKRKKVLQRDADKQKRKTEKINSTELSAEGFAYHITEGGYLGEVVYDGGGNFFVLYDTVDTCIGINKIFTREILENIGTLKVVCTYIEVDSSLKDWTGDSEKLRNKHRRNEAKNGSLKPYNGSTLTAVDPNTSMPLVEDLKNMGSWKFKESRKHFGVEGRVSRESYAKLMKFSEEQEKNGEEYGEQILDNLVREEDNSLLAVIYIDGNGMGAYVENCMKDHNGHPLTSDYKTRINRLREVSAHIQQEYVLKRKKAIEERLMAKYPGDKNYTNRFVVFAGDEMNFIVKAKDALDAVEAYFSVDENGKTADNISSCAGIAIFHSHAPYAEAYRIAEECCENGKTRMKKMKETGTCYLDYQYCQSGLGRDLDTIRELENGDLISKPWLMNWGDNPNHSVTLKEIRQIVDELNLLGARSNVKVLAERAKSSLADFDWEMERIYAHQPKDIQQQVKHLFKEMSGEKRRKMVYDIVIAYDLWFRPVMVSKQETAEEV